MDNKIVGEAMDVGKHEAMHMVKNKLNPKANEAQLSKLNPKLDEAQLSAQVKAKNGDLEKLIEQINKANDAMRKQIEHLTH